MTGFIDADQVHPLFVIHKPGKDLSAGEIDVMKSLWAHAPFGEWDINPASIYFLGREKDAEGPAVTTLTLSLGQDIPGEIWKLEKFVTSSCLRKHGYGTELLEHALVYAKDWSEASYVQLICRKTQQVIRICEKLGFELAEEIPYDVPLLRYLYSLR